MRTVKQLAMQAYNACELKERPDDERFWAINYDGLDFDLQSLVREAHDGLMPHDWIYSAIVEALELISECDSFDDFEKRVNEIESDIQTYKLIQWLHTPDFRERANEAIQDGCETIEGAAQWAQGRLKQEIAGQIWEYLENTANELNDEENE